ncbi:hypothetical protein MN608_05314 [Microdochium nivale]|nr:hypothetical protein MN608_05314 [Microdochium nivale]
MSASDLRDIRSGAQDAKRDRDHKKKWAQGGRGLPGVVGAKDIFTFVPGVDDGGRVRPEKLWRGNRYPTHNVSKLLRPTSHYNLPQSRFRANVDARVQVSDPDNRSDFLADDADLARGPHIQTDGFLYSFDKKGPSGSLPLDVYMTENRRAKRKEDRNDQRDYGLVDEYGNEAEGSKAWGRIRRPANAPVEEQTELDRDDGGFELI